MLCMPLMCLLEICQILALFKMLFVSCLFSNSGHLLIQDIGIQSLVKLKGILRMAALLLGSLDISSKKEALQLVDGIIENMNRN